MCGYCLVKIGFCACCVVNIHRGVLDAKMNPDTRGRANFQFRNKKLLIKKYPDKVNGTLKLEIVPKF